MTIYSIFSHVTGLQWFGQFTFYYWVVKSVAVNLYDNGYKKSNDEIT